MNLVNSIELGTLAAALSFVVCAFFRMMQLAIVRCRVSKLRELGRRSPRRWKFARLIRSQTGRFLFVCQAGFFVGALWLGLALAVVAHKALPVGILGENGSLNFLLLTVAVFVAASVPLLLLQICRAVAFNYPEQYLISFAALFVRITALISPLIQAVDSTLAGLLRLFGLEYPCERQIAVPADEIREIVEASGDAGEIEEGEKEMIKGVFLLGDTTVRELMTPRVDVVSLPVDASVKEVSDIFLNEKLSRILITGETLDDVRGVVHVKDLLPLIGVEPKEFSISAIMRPACMVPGSKKVNEVLQEFRSHAIHFAVVLDEHGGVDGIVTIEDLLEEIVGEVFDEFDSPADEVEITKTKSGDFLIDGSLSVSDFNERFRSQIPEEGEFDTIAGYLIHKLSRMPRMGESIDCEGTRVRVEKVEDNRITELRVLKRRRALKLTKVSNPESMAASAESKNFEVQRQTRVVTR